MNSKVVAGIVRHRNRASLFLIFLVGSLVRLLNLATIRHGYDQSYPMYDALQMLDGGKLLLAGQPSSIFLDNPALMSYIQALPLIIWRSPWSAYLFITFLNWLAIWFVYRLGRRLWDERTGLLAALLFAFNPWVVFFSGLTWVQGLVPLCAAVAAWGLWPALVDERCPHAAGRVLVAGLAVVVMALTYIQALGILLPVSLLLLIFRRQVPARPIIVSGAIFAIGLLVYGIGLSARWDANVEKLASFSSDSKFRLTWDGIEHSLRLVTGRDYEAARDQTEPGRLRQTLSIAAHYALAAAVFSGVIQAGLAWRGNGRHRRIGTILIFWWGLPILFTTYSPYLVHPHYLLLGLPAGHLLAAWGLSPLLEQRTLRSITAVVLTLIASLFLVKVHQAGRAVSENPMPPGFNGWGLFAGQRLGTQVRQLSFPPQSSDEVYPRRIYAQGEDAVHSSLSGTYLTVLNELSYPDYVILPGETPLLYVLSGEEDRLNVFGPLHETFPERALSAPNGTVFSFVRVLPYSREAALALPEVTIDWPSEAGLTLLGYTLDGPPHATPGAVISGTAYWRVDSLPPERNERYIAFFRHLLNDQFQIVANVTGPGQWGYRWHAGDVHVEYFQVEVPEDTGPGAYQLAIGLFDPVQQTSYSLYGPEGGAPVYTIPFTIRR